MVASESVSAIVSSEQVSHDEEPSSSAASSCSVRPKSVQYLVEAQPEILTLMYPGAQPSP